MNRYANTTFLMCLPRSRAAWLCAFLSPGATTLLDPLRQCRNVAGDLKFAVDKAIDGDPGRPVFVADTTAVCFHNQIAAAFPGARFLFVRRPLRDAEKSMRAQGQPALSLAVVHDKFYDATEALYWHYTLWVPYDEIDRRLHDIWRFVGIPAPLSDDHAKTMISTNIQHPTPGQCKGVAA